MKDALSAQGEGRTNWRRFAIAAVIPGAVAGALVAGVASGALAASFSVSGTTFKLSADKLVGNGFTQYSGALGTEAGKTDPTKNIPAAMSGIKTAQIYNLCQTVKVGTFVLRIEAGKDAAHPVEASDLVIGMSELSGDATFKNIDIGVDAGTLTRDGRPGSAHGEAGTKAFGQEAESVTIDGLKQVAYSTSASTFKLTGMRLKLYLAGGQECFADQ
ncbi:hypothetical protein BJ973_001362 [Actinoplanes tereljensis]|uniref:Cholesterol esterase n=1 Tax=Paractinoplanes tereljensis TaxID=571912 RepID=A0A919NMW5_9ACTN|nr:DUF6230 family protein [Actinoplanes tereljensis]GIF20732.1 cholesterol esterase [Actinoplanes tereljensis]